MKAVAAALVLIAGAAVVLWYGNTLNSWVLGGLIGGLAALLLSIPISLTLFSFMSRRHDEQLKAAVQEEVSLARLYDYPEVPARSVQEVYEVESYALPQDEEWDEDEEEDFSYPPSRPVRRLPAPASPRVPAERQGGLSRRLPAAQRSEYLPGVSRQPSRSVPLARDKDIPARHATGRHIHYPGFPGYQPEVSRSQHRSAALRAARIEAAQQRRFADIEELPTYTSKHIRPGQSFAEQRGQIMERRPSRQLPNHYPRRPRRTVDASPSQDGLQRSLPAEGESSAGRLVRRKEPQTDYLNNGSFQTGPMHYPQTDKIAPSATWEEEPPDADSIAAPTQRPLVRRAPYMYGDDPLRQELAQHLEPPIVRRSSRYLSTDYANNAE